MANPFINMTDPDGIHRRLYQSQGTYIKTTPTLKRSPLLAVVLAVNPTILALALLVRVIFLSKAPISKNFGTVALLAGIDKGSLDIVRGAAYSGKIKRDIRVRFSASSTDEKQRSENSQSSKGHKTGVITMHLESLDKGRTAT